MSKDKKHPYITSSGILTQVFSTFRSNFPSKVDSTTLQKLSLAPNNESVVITTLKFLGFLEENGTRTKVANDVFLKHDDDEFKTALKKEVKKAYQELFSIHGDSSWTLEKDKLINFFRVTDETSSLTAKRQAVAFETLSSLSGQNNIGINSARSKKSANKKETVKSKASSSQLGKEKPGKNLDFESSNLGLTVRIEINLPAQGDQETYDRIFQSIRKNLLDR